MTFELLADAKAPKPAWSEGPVKVTVSGGRWGHSLGSKTAIKSEILASLDPLSALEHRRGRDAAAHASERRALRLGR